MKEPEVKREIKRILEENGVLPKVKALAEAQRGIDPSLPHVNNINGYYTMPSSTGMGDNGMGDFLLCVSGRYIEIEAKGSGEPAASRQIKHNKVIEAAGGQYFTVIGEDGVTTFEPFISSLIATFVQVRSIVAEQMEDLSLELDEEVTVH